MHGQNSTTVLLVHIAHSSLVSALHSIVTGSIFSGEDHGIHCWWDRIRSNQLYSGSECCAQCLPDFLIMVIQIHNIIGFTLLYFKMSVIPLVLETKMVDVGKLISLGKLLVRKISWFVLTTTSATLILSRVFGADHITRIAYIYSRLTRTHSLTFSLTETAHTLSLLHFDFQQSTPRKCILSATFFFPVLPFRLDLFQPRIQPQKFHQSQKETNNQRGRRHVPPRIRCYISIYRYLTWNT